MVEHNASLTAHQTLFGSFTSKSFAGKTNGEAYRTLLLVAPTSAGKTFRQILLAKLLRQRALVLCKTNLIRKAWEDGERICFIFG